MRILYPSKDHNSSGGGSMPGHCWGSAISWSVPGGSRWDISNFFRTVRPIFKLGYGCLLHLLTQGQGIFFNENSLAKWTNIALDSTKLPLPGPLLVSCQCWESTNCNVIQQVVAVTPSITFSFLSCSLLAYLHFSSFLLPTLCFSTLFRPSLFVPSFICVCVCINIRKAHSTSSALTSLLRSRMLTKLPFMHLTEINREKIKIMDNLICFLYMFLLGWTIWSCQYCFDLQK